MRATISFEADVSRVNDIMRSLVLEESNALQDALMSLEKATPDRIAEGIADALGHIYGVANQLEQYRSMMISFERARLESSFPQGQPTDEEAAQSPPPVESMAQLRSVLENMSNFDSFIDKINTQEEDITNDEQSPEG